jgi:co-chaperonin GroES (HSP10)
MKPIHKKILFRSFKGSETTEGGLFIPDSVRKLSNKGEIVEVGEGVTKVKKGDIGFRVKDWGEEFVVNNEPHFLMEETAILALE